MAAEDGFEHYSPSINQPSSEWVAVTPDDDTDLAFLPRAVWVGTGGDLTCITEEGSTTTITVPDATLLPVRPARIKSTGTTATGIVILK
jgi:hypothetical protein